MKDIQRVPAIEKMDEIVSFIYSNPKSTQSTIYKNLSIPKTTLHRLLASLVETEFLFLSNSKYEIGNKFFLFSKKHDKSIFLKNLVTPYLEELSLKYNETFKLSILDKKQVRTIAKIESNCLIKVTVSDNAIFPIHAGAASKLLICQMNESEVLSLINLPLQSYTKNTIVDFDQFLDTLFQINLKKIAYDNEEYLEGIKAVALPIFNKHNRIIAAISCPYFSPNFKEEKINPLIKDMKRICNLISEKI